MLIDATTLDFDEKVDQEGFILLDFFAPWWDPCKVLGSVLHEIAEENPDLSIVKVDVGQEPDLAKRYGVRGVPTLIYVKDRNHVDKTTGFRSKEQIMELVEKYK